MSQNQRDTMIRVTPNTSRGISLIAISLGYNKKEFLEILSKTTLNSIGNRRFTIEIKEKG